jgi:hypothetical protein
MHFFSSLIGSTARALLETDEAKLLMGDVVAAARRKFGSDAAGNAFERVCSDYDKLLGRAINTIGQACAPAFEAATADQRIELGASMLLVQRAMISSPEPIAFFHEAFVQRNAPDILSGIDASDIQLMFSELTENVTDPEQIKAHKQMEDWATAELQRSGDGKVFYHKMQWRKE